MGRVPVAELDSAATDTAFFPLLPFLSFFLVLSYSSTRTAFAIYLAVTCSIANLPSFSPRREAQKKEDLEVHRLPLLKTGEALVERGESGTQLVHRRCVQHLA